MQDQSWWVKGNYEICDNKRDKLNLELRIRLGSINQDPKLWFPNIPQDISCITTPRRASTVYTGMITLSKDTVYMVL